MQASSPMFVCTWSRDLSKNTCQQLSERGCYSVYMLRTITSWMLQQILFAQMKLFFAQKKFPLKHNIYACKMHLHVLRTEAQNIKEYLDWCDIRDLTDLKFPGRERWAEYGKERQNDLWQKSWKVTFQIFNWFKTVQTEEKTSI